MEIKVKFKRMSNFSEKLKLLLKRNGLTALAFAKSQNVSHTAVAKWMKGMANPTPEKTVEIASYFGLNVDILINDNLTLPNETKKNYSIRDTETVKIREDFEKLMALKNEISESLSEFSAMFDKRLSNIEKILRDKKF